jgi:hypothetical protein
MHPRRDFGSKGASHAAEKALNLAEAPEKRTEGAEALIDSVGVMRELKPPPPSGLNFSVASFASLRNAPDESQLPCSSPSP